MPLRGQEQFLAYTRRPRRVDEAALFVAYARDQASAGHIAEAKRRSTS